MFSCRMRRGVCRFGGQVLLLALLVGGTGQAVGADLPAVDALNVQATGHRATNPANPARLASYRVSEERHLGLPTFLTAADSNPRRAGVMQVTANPVQVARDYLKSLAPAYKISAAEIEALPELGRQRLPSGAVLVQFGNRVHGIDVFRERASVLIGADGRLVSIGGYVSGVSSVASANPASLFRQGPEAAVSSALSDFGAATSAVASRLLDAGEKAGYQLFTLAPGAPVELVSPARAKPVFFRQSHGLVPAWYVEVDVAENAGTSGGYYSYVIGAKSGQLLFRHNLTNDATAFSYRVWAETTAPYLPYPGPQGRNGTPHPTGNPDGYQGPFVAPNLVSLVNALAPGSVAENDPWLPDAATVTTGNNVDAYADLSSPDGFNTGDLRPTTTSAHAFDRTYDTNQDPQSNQTQMQAAVTQLFYMNNWLHDWYYDNGFDEAAGNAQNDNYGRGGFGGDRIQAQGQDYSGMNNANMSTPADGSSPRMQMYVFTGNGASRVINASSTPGINPELPAKAASFGPTSFDLTRDVVLVDDGTVAPTEACSPLVNDAVVSGKIALIKRGNCAFALKVKHAQDVGAAAALIYNHNNDGTLSPMGGSDNTVTIPSQGLNYSDGTAIVTALGNTSAISLRMQTTAGLRRDGTIDNAIIAHEWGHYISNRLVQNSSGLTTNQSGGMGEGFGDFHALLMMVKEEDALVASNPNFSGVYAEAAYVSGGDSFPVSPNQGFYYGIRRYPYSTDFAKNPLTYKYVENGVALPSSPPPAFGQDGASNAEVHNTGEVWANALWECYAALLRDTTRLTFAQAQDRMKTYMVAGYKLMPPAPTFMEARDAILSAAHANDPQDFALCAAGFARRGFGSGAEPPTDRYGADNAGVVESFSVDGALEVAGIDLDDSGSSCDGDGILDNGEEGNVLVTVRNSGFSATPQITLDMSSPDSVLGFPNSQVTVPAVDTLSSAVYAIPVTLHGAIGTPVVTIDVAASASGLATANGSGKFRVNSDSVASASTTDDFEAENFAWTPAVIGLPTNPDFLWSRTEINSDPAQHVAYAPDAGAPGQSILVSPVMQVNASGEFKISYRQRHVFEGDASANYDGGVVEISSDGGATWQDVTAAGGTFGLGSAYNGVISNCCSNPLAGRNAFVKSNPGWPAFATVTINFGTAMAGKSVQVRFVIATDAAVGDDGWEIDDFAATNIGNTPFPMLLPDANACLPDLIFQDGFEPAP